LTVWSSCRGPRLFAASELVVVLSGTLRSASSTAWSARPRQARTRPISTTTISAQFTRVPSTIGLRACPERRQSAKASGSALEIITGPNPQIGPRCGIGEERGAGTLLDPGTPVQLGEDHRLWLFSFLDCNLCCSTAMVCRYDCSGEALLRSKTAASFSKKSYC
jgi:hypothetical protein